MNIFKEPKLNLQLISLVIIGLLIVAVSSVFSKEEPPLKKDIEVKEPVYQIVPLLKSDLEYPVISAQSVYAVDEKGHILYEKDPEKLSLPASTAKIVTALVAMEYFSPRMVIRVHRPNVVGQKMGLLEDEQITVEDLLYGLLVYSANDAAEVLASNYPGGRENFISAMNSKAKQLGLQNTQFAHPAGLDDSGQYTTAKDLVIVSQELMKEEYLAGIVGTKNITVTSIDGEIKHKLENINKLVGEVEGVLGVKTGWTENARENLVTYLERSDNGVYIALLGSQNRFGETEEIIDWIYDSYSWVEIAVSVP